MPRILRVTDADGVPLGAVDSADGVKGVVKGFDPGRYQVDEDSTSQVRLP